MRVFARKASTSLSASMRRGGGAFSETGRGSCSVGLRFRPRAPSAPSAGGGGVPARKPRGVRSRGPRPGVASRPLRLPAATPAPGAVRRPSRPCGAEAAATSGWDGCSTAAYSDSARCKAARKSSLFRCASGTASGTASAPAAASPPPPLGPVAATPAEARRKRSGSSALRHPRRNVPDAAGASPAFVAAAARGAPAPASPGKVQPGAVGIAGAWLPVAGATTCTSASATAGGKRLCRLLFCWRRSSVRSRSRACCSLTWA
mmetsp:Transcript_111738/g.249373  ORF Transcript_111738/g.249373 Transcript_111738/m.249373 type:complete len:261 (+) Transcript_111738:896-1678(+)